VPEEVSRALAPYAQAGRIRYSGELLKVPISGTLVPVGGGRHVLYVNGGMRSAARVGVGDTVTIELRATAEGEIVVPPDIARALAAIRGAATAFAGLPPSHRRELLRFIDDARTPATRSRRIQQVSDHLLHKPGNSRATGALERPLWTCPRCGNQFFTANQYHSCATHSVDEAFAGKPAEIRTLFDRFREMVEMCGPTKPVAYRDRVAFMVRVRFAGAVPRHRWLDISLWLTRRVDSPRFTRIETLHPNAHIHTLRVTALDQLDGQVAEWIREAYAVGCQQHLAAGGSGGAPLALMRGEQA
jgi:hypothetical protein